MEYEGVEVVWIRGAKATLHIYENGNEVEEVGMYELKTRDEILKLMEEKGLHKKSQEDLSKEKSLHQAEKDIDALESSPFDGMMTTYLSILTFSMLALVCIRRTKHRKSRALRKTESQNLTV